MKIFSYLFQITILLPLPIIYCQIFYSLLLHPHFTLIHFCIFYLLPFCIFVSFYLSEICLDDLLSCSNPLILSLISSLLLFSYIDLLNLNYYIFNICDCHYIFLYSELIIFYFVLFYGLLFFYLFQNPKYQFSSHYQIALLFGIFMA